MSRAGSKEYCRAAASAAPEEYLGEKPQVLQAEIPGYLINLIAVHREPDYAIYFFRAYPGIVASPFYCLQRQTHLAAAGILRVLGICDADNT